jgi:DNA-binding FrmR family transcriptional regulator
MRTLKKSLEYRRGCGRVIQLLEAMQLRSIVSHVIWHHLMHFHEDAHHLKSEVARVKKLLFADAYFQRVRQKLRPRTL